MKVLKSVCTLMDMLRNIMGLGSTRRVEILIGLVCGVTLYSLTYQLVHYIITMVSLSKTNLTTLCLAVAVFIPLYIIPLVVIYQLRQANTKLKSTYRVMLRTEKMLRRHNEELELGRLQLADMAHKDRLTGLKNRRQFDTQFAQYFHAAECGLEDFELILIDLNDFKPINDTHGHAVGDELLRQVGVRLREICCGHRADVFRLGGDEFAILLKMEKDAPLEPFANAISNAIEHKFEIQNKIITISAAIGSTSFNNQLSTSELFVETDSKLYAEKAKKASSNNNEKLTDSVTWLA